MRKIKWGVLGTANIARGRTIPGMRLAENCIMEAVAGRSLEKAEAFREQFGFNKAYGSYEELLADPEVEAVYICLPNTLHKEWSIRAAKAGKHILCEKPLAPTAADIEEMFRAAEENGVLLMEAFAYLHNPLTTAVKTEIEEGAIGDVVYMESAFITSDYDLSNIRMRRETAGGALYDLGCYTTSQILWMIGEEPEDVKAFAQFSPEGVDVYTAGLLTFPGGKRGAFQCGMVLATNKDDFTDHFEIHGTEGTILADTEINMPGILHYTIKRGDRIEKKTVQAPHNYQLEVEQLGRAIAEGEELYVSHEFTLRNARTLDRILKEIGY
ncbi:MAG: Gfo/Idh/MocA family oxidoreductase [Clostridia bacterium]|nr:Gfo/Idh/MocA family oxidoreductase [Clostridia bacterium]